MTVSALHSLRRELTCLLTCGRHSLVTGTQNDIVVSWITLRGMIKVYWLDDLTLAYIFDHAVLCASAASWGRGLHLIISQFRTKHSSSNCPNYVRRTKTSKSSIKKRIIVRGTVRSMFGEQKVRRIKNGHKRSVWSYIPTYFAFKKTDSFSFELSAEGGLDFCVRSTPERSDGVANTFWWTLIFTHHAYPQRFQEAVLNA